MDEFRRDQRAVMICPQLNVSSGSKTPKGIFRTLALSFVWIAFQSYCYPFSLTVCGRISACGTEHAFSVHCFNLVRFTLELPQLGKNCGTGRKRFKKGIWVSPKGRGAKKGYMVRTWEDPVHIRTSAVSSGLTKGTPTFLGRSRALLFNFTHM